MEPRAWHRRIQGVKILSVAVMAGALLVPPAALAKFRISVAANNATPRVGQRVTLVVRSELALKYNLRLIAVAPGAPVFDVVATITGDASNPDPKVAQHGFEVKLARLSPDRWRGVARFSRPGRWRVVVPNGASVGVMMPSGAASLALRVGQRR
jgi:hypothetical protein